MEAVRGVMPDNGSTGCGLAIGWRAPHLAQNWSVGFTVFPQLLQKGIYSFNTLRQNLMFRQRGVRGGPEPDVRSLQVVWPQLQHLRFERITADQIMIAGVLLRKPAIGYRNVERCWTGQVQLNRFGAFFERLQAVVTQFARLGPPLPLLTDSQRF